MDRTGAQRDPSDIRTPVMRRGDFLGVFGVLETPAGILFARNRRRIGGRSRLTWDLPGGQVEPGETLPEALAREWREETGLRIAVGEMLFVQEGEKVVGAQRAYVWRSFFFRVARTGGRLRAGAEVSAVRFLPRARLARWLTAPYHRGFLLWLVDGGLYLTERWHEPTTAAIRPGRQPARGITGRRDRRP